MVTGPMTPRPNAPLPENIPIFPLAGALLLPKGQLPLNIFEPRYLRMIDDALGGPRLIGMVQPIADPGSDFADDTGTPPPIFDIGCVGRITTFSETGDGRYHIVLTGVSRFGVEREVSSDTPYRMIDADWDRYANDRHKDETASQIDRELFLQIMSDYMKEAGLTADWEAASSASVESLVLSMSLGCPFAPNEKQALLEAPTVADRADCLMALMEMAGGADPMVQ